ncbi:unnamed protein product [Clavelina lepadiformis]|uniref:Protein transport protein Sec24C n=1 Tax=Clavelina lepadiformis TaxID=159417 RepID=A0ABP0EWV2_CLALP
MMQPTGYPPNQGPPAGQGSGYGGYPNMPQSTGYNQPPGVPSASASMYNGSGNVTYAQPGVLQTTKQMPPATSGTMPTQQPPPSAMNGYHYQPQYQPPMGQYPPSHTGYGQHVSTAPLGGHPPPSHYSAAPAAPTQPPQQGYGAPPPVSAGGGGYRPNYSAPPPPTSGQAGHPVPGGPPGTAGYNQSPGPQQPSMQPPVQGMQNMQINNNASASYAAPPPSGLPASSMSGITPGYPPKPGAGPGMQPSPYPNPNAAAPTKRLDPDAMPSPIQVIEDDRMNRGTEIFKTQGRGLVPPLVTTKFVVEDQGSASPRFIRCTTYNLPATSDMAKTCMVPMSLSIKPMARLPQGEAPPLIVDPGAEGPIRCKRCKAYMCPQFSFTDGGRRFQCVLCNAITETPHNYFDHLDHMNQRVDKFNRPELCRGSYEFVATKDYCRNDKFPNPPAFIFAIDVSYNAIKSGFVELLCRQLSSLLDHLPREGNQEHSSVKVGFITYNSILHFYNLNSSLAQPQMMVVSDVNDVFVPLQDGFLVDLQQSRHVIESLLTQIPEMFKDTRETELVFAPLVQAAVQAVKSAECAGKLFMFHTSLPIGEAPGKLKNRDDRKLIGTDKEKTLFAPSSNFYEKLAKDCVTQALSVDLFLFPNQYIDIASIGQISQLTGGQIYKYNFFRADIDGDRFIKDLAHDIQRDIVFDAVLRARTSTGVRPVEFIGALHMTNTTDVELAAIDCDKSIHVQLKHDDKIQEEYGAFVQVALLYTSVSGQRRLRLHNINLSVCTQYADLYRSCETDVFMNYLAKKSVNLGCQIATAKIREDLLSQASVILAMYRKHVASPSSPGQLILPECMKLLPVYLNCLLKNDAIHSSHDISTDDRAYLRQLILSMDVDETQLFFYPKLLPLLQSTTNDDGIPLAVRCSEDKLQDNQVFILENGVSMFLWIGQAVDPTWIQNVFGAQSAAQIDIDLGSLLVFDNDDSRNLREVVSKLQAGRTRQMKLTIVRQRDKLEPWFRHFLVEDRGAGGAASYVDFLCHMHKEIRTLLS